MFFYFRDYLSYIQNNNKTLTPLRLLDYTAQFMLVMLAVKRKEAYVYIEIDSILDSNFYSRYV